LARSYGHANASHAQNAARQHTHHEAGCNFRHVLVLRDPEQTAHLAVVVEPEGDRPPVLTIHSPGGGAFETHIVAPSGERYIGMVHTMVALVVRRPCGDLVLIGGYCAGDHELRIMDPWAQDAPRPLRGHTRRPIGAAVVTSGRLVTMDEGGLLLVWSPRDKTSKAWDRVSSVQLKPAVDRSVGNMTPTLCVACGCLVATVDTVLANAQSAALRKGEASDAKPVIAIDWWDVDGVAPVAVRPRGCKRLPCACRSDSSACVRMSAGAHRADRRATGFRSSR
jgi:hypothetical protein